MKFSTTAACVLLLNVAVVLAQDVPDFITPDIQFGTEAPDKDAPITTEDPENKPTPPAETTPEEVKPTEPAELPTEPDPDCGLPMPENCSGVMCDVSVLQNCDAPVLFAKQCCPVCPANPDLCDGVTCNPGEVCTVHDCHAICCSDIHAKKQKAKRRRIGRTAYGLRHRFRTTQPTTQQVDHHEKLRCRFNLTENCTLRFSKPPATGGQCGNSTCTEMEKCVIKEKRLRLFRRRAFSWFLRTSRRSHFCCPTFRPECPTVPKPTVLGKCHLPGQPIPPEPCMCQCTYLLFHRQGHILFQRIYRPCRSTQCPFSNMARVLTCSCKCLRRTRTRRTLQWGRPSHATTTKTCPKLPELNTSQCRRV